MARRRTPGGGELRVLRPRLPGNSGRAPTCNSAPKAGASSGLPRPAYVDISTRVTGTFSLTPGRRPLGGQLTARPTRRSAARSLLGRTRSRRTCASARTSWTASFHSRSSFRGPTCCVRRAVAINCIDLRIFGKDSEGVSSFVPVTRRPRIAARPGPTAVPFFFGPPRRQPRQATTPAGTGPTCAAADVHSGGAGTSVG